MLGVALFALGTGIVDEKATGVELEHVAWAIGFRKELTGEEELAGLAGESETEFDLGRHGVEAAA